MGSMSRRRFLGMSAGVAGAAAVASLSATLRKALAIAPAGRSLSAVRHVVVLMQENRSFDHYFGTLAGVRGFDDASAARLVDGRYVFAQGDGDAMLPFRLAAPHGDASCAPDLDHSWQGTHRAWNGGRWNDWIGAKGVATMGHLTRADIPFHFALADAFTVCDHYFCSVMGPTNPNRLYLWSGTIDAEGRGGGPVVENGATGLRWTTYPERLQKAGIDWKVYQNVSDNYDDNALAWFAAFERAKPGTPLFDRGMASVPSTSGSTADDIVAALRADVLGGTLPAVSWIVAPEKASEHPSWSPAAGARLIGDVLDALTADPSVWASTVFLLNYDENDGYFDHVPPPVAPDGTPGEFVGSEPIGLGPRVPMIAMSPWSRGGFVCSETFDHTSVLRFLETWLGIAEPNISPWRRAICGDLTSAFDFESATYSIPPLPTVAAEHGDATAQHVAVTPPSRARMPAQEEGARRVRELPYRCEATLVRHGAEVKIRLSNAAEPSRSPPSVQFSVRTIGDAAAPERFDLAPGEWRDVDIVTTRDAFDVEVHGPAGFVRRFASALAASSPSLSS